MHIVSRQKVKKQVRTEISIRIASGSSFYIVTACPSSTYFIEYNNMLEQNEMCELVHSRSRIPLPSYCMDGFPIVVYCQDAYLNSQAAALRHQTNDNLGFVLATAGETYHTDSVSSPEM